MQSLAWLDEAVPRKRLPALDVVGEGGRHPCRGLVEDLVKQVQMLRVHVVLQHILLQPRPSDRPPLGDPQPDCPLVLAALVLAQPPGDVTDVPGRAQPEKPPLLGGELLHRSDDLRAQPHEPEYPCHSWSHMRGPPRGGLRRRQGDAVRERRVRNPLPPLCTPPDCTDIRLPNMVRRGRRFATGVTPAAAWR